MPPGTTSGEESAPPRGGTLLLAPIPNVEVISVPDRGRGNLEATIEELNGLDEVEYAEPDYIVYPHATPDDPRYGDLWNMKAGGGGCNAEGAWAQNTGSSDVVVAVIDTGIQYEHPDLAANMWSNSGEVTGNGIDDDNNDFVDDIYGWDFFHNDNEVYDGIPQDDDHGTHVAGTIGGRGNNGVGVVGVNWDVGIMSLKFLGPQGGYTSDAVSALEYVVEQKSRGVNIVATNNSWGGGGYLQSLKDAIQAACDAGILFVASAGNNGSDNDSISKYPANYGYGNSAVPCVMSVASITSTGGLSGFSNYGDRSVHLAAPGSSILSTVPTDTYGTKSGTSMAAPHVSGAAALCASINPSLTALEIKSNIMDGVQKKNSLKRKVISGGQLDVGAMANLCSGGTGGEPEPEPEPCETEICTSDGSECCVGKCHPRGRGCKN